MEEKKLVRVTVMSKNKIAYLHMHNVKEEKVDIVYDSKKDKDYLVFYFADTDRFREICNEYKCNYTIIEFLKSYKKLNRQIRQVLADKEIEKFIEKFDTETQDILYKNGIVLNTYKIKNNTITMFYENLKTGNIKSIEIYKECDIDIAYDRIVDLFRE